MTMYIVKYILVLITCTFTCSFILIAIENIFNIKLSLFVFFIAGCISGCIVPLLVKKND